MSWWKNFSNEISGLLPSGLNPRQWLTRAKDNKGGFHQYPYLKAEASDPTKWNDADDVPVFSGEDPVDPDYLPIYRTDPGLLDLHPERMELHMEASVGGHLPLDPSGVRIAAESLTEQQLADQFVFPAKYRLVRIPDVSQWPLSSNPADPNYFLYTGDNSGYWKLIERLEYVGTTVYQYSTAYTDGGAPPWDETDGYGFQAALDWDPNWSDDQKPEHEYYRKKTGVSSWSRPILIRSRDTDYYANRFIRSATKPALPEMYDENFNRNNFPSGYVDSADQTVGVDSLWMIEALFSEFRQIKESWRGPILIKETASYVRYSKTGEFDPNDFVDQDTVVVDGGANDLLLESKGWMNFEGGEYFDKDQYIYMSYREDDISGVNTYTPWRTVKIANEAGISIVTIYRQFDYPTDENTVQGFIPSTGDYQKAGWIHIAPEEAENKVTFSSTGQMTASGKLIGEWSKPKKVTPKPTYTDIVQRPYGDVFRFKEGSSNDPARTTLVLEAELYYGGKDGEKVHLRNPNPVEYFWYKVFDNNQLTDTAGGNDHNGEAFPVPLADNGGSIVLTESGRVIEFSHSEVTGDAIFVCVQRLHHDQTGNNYTDFIERIRIQDIPDAIDIYACSLQIIPNILFDDGLGNISASNIILRAIWSNVVPDKVRYSYSYDNTNWTVITTDTSPDSSGEDEHTLSVATEFGVGGHWENKTLVYYKAELLDVSDQLIVDAKNDLTKVVSGANGIDSVSVDMERLSYNLITDIGGNALAGELGASGKAESKVRLFDGSTEKTLAADFTVELDTSPYSGGVTQAVCVNQDNNHKVYISAWDSTKITGSVKIKITYGAKVFYRRFDITAYKDEPGALIPFVSADGQRYAFTIDNDSNIILRAKLYHKSQEATGEIGSGISYQWYKNGVAISGQVNDNLTVTKPATHQYDHYSCTLEYNSRKFSDGVTIEDQIDGRTQYLFYHGQTKPAKPNLAFNRYWYKQISKTDNPAVGGYTPILGDYYPHNDGYVVNQWDYVNMKLYGTINSAEVLALYYEDGRILRGSMSVNGAFNFSSRHQLSAPKDPNYYFRLVASNNFPANQTITLELYSDWSPKHMGGDYVWMSMKPAEAAASEWSEPVLITGKGVQGNTGYLYVPIWKESATKPSLPSNSLTADQVRTSAGWSYKADFSGANKVWKAYRAFVGQGLTYDTNNVPTTGFASNSVWIGPFLDGVVQPEDGSPGGIGPMPAHEWRDGRYLKFETAVGVWGTEHDLRGPQGDSITVYFQSSEPSSPRAGDLWVKT